MKLEGIHHVTCITGDAPRNVHFYAEVLGLRMVKKTVNQDDPTIYHLFYADEKGSAGSDITFFEYPGAQRGEAGAGMVHRIAFRVASQDALAFWADRLGSHGIAASPEGDAMRLEDPEGLGLELRVTQTQDQPLTAEHPEVPSEHALQGFDGVRAYTASVERSRRLLEDTLGFRPLGGAEFESRGERRGSFYGYDEMRRRGVQGAGTVHHVAWASTMDEHEPWRTRVLEAGMSPTPIIDRFWFRSIYFREPSGVLFEIATLGPGFHADEPMDLLGESLSLPPAYEHLRGELEKVLTPLPELTRQRLRR